MDHIIKERYPTFIDALRDLDDALSLLSLFANLPATATVPPRTIALCQRLCLEFQHFLIATNSLRKSFLSIKGIYYQATVQGQDILWLVPYKFVQRVTGDVDFRIMGTFVEFYSTLLGFVNFRLYTSIGLVYPPKFNASSDEHGGELGAFTLEGRIIEVPEESGALLNGHTNGVSALNVDIQEQIDAVTLLSEPHNELEERKKFEGEDNINDSIDKFEPLGEDADTLPQPEISGIEAAKLFSSFSFFLSRETPRQPLEFILRAFGCKRIGWDAVLGDGAFMHDESDPSITHQIVDRPPLVPIGSAEVSAQNKEVANDGAMHVSRPGDRVPGRIYIQPQWVWDCVNQAKLLRPDLYAPGATLPPHLSPWVKATKGVYDPGVPLAEQEREGEAEETEGMDEDEDEDEDGSDGEEPKVGGIHVAAPESSLVDFNAADLHGMDVAAFGSGSSRPSSPAASSFSGFGSDPALSSSDESSKEHTRHQRELLAEATGLPFAHSSFSNGDDFNAKKVEETPSKKTKLRAAGEAARKKAAKRRRVEEEELERRKMMMGRRKRKVLEKMMFSNARRDEEAKRLRGKRRRLERGKQVEI